MDAFGKHKLGEFELLDPCEKATAFGIIAVGWFENTCNDCSQADGKNQGNPVLGAWPQDADESV